MPNHLHKLVFLFAAFSSFFPKQFLSILVYNNEFSFFLESNLPTLLYNVKMILMLIILLKLFLIRVYTVYNNIQYHAILVHHFLKRNYNVLSYLGYVELL